MKLTEETVRPLFTPTDFQRGRAYYKLGRVQEIKVKREGETIEVVCGVQGQELYAVRVQIRGETLAGRCSCPWYRGGHMCKHLAAAMLACADLEELGAEEPAAASDYSAKRMLRAYTEKSAQQIRQSAERPVRLVPRICPSWGRDYPAFAFQVGIDRLYAVQNVRRFVENVIRRETAGYGKSLKFCHAPEMFDPEGQKLIAILTDQFSAGRSMGGGDLSAFDDSLLFFKGQRNRILLTGSAFDQIFDLYQGRRMEAGPGEEAGDYSFAARDPGASLTLEPLDKAARLRLEMEGDGDGWEFFGSTRNLYAMGSGQLLRCSQKFREQVFPLFQKGARVMTLSRRDLPVFCSCVLPEIQDAVTIDDPEQLLQAYLPDECVPCFLFDMEDSELTMLLDFRYEAERFNCFSQPEQAVKRDIRTEQAAMALAERFFPGRYGSRFLLAGDDDVFGLLNDELGRFQELGEVYLSDRLRAKRFRSRRPAVGISVSQGMLQLDLDAGDFPPEELESLYQSLLKRRRYYRLADGRFLPLDGSSCETLAEMAHMLRISPEELEKGRVRLPSSRALYLNSLLSGREDVQVRQDQQFREMVRSFKDLQEGGFPLPEGMGEILRPYQREGFQWLKTLEHFGFGGILADEMGLGKTLQMIAFLASLDPEKREGPSLIVCPASLILNWADELARFAPNLTCALIMGNARERAAQIADGAGRDLWVTSYELLRQDIEQYEPLRFTCCILDEGQHIKNQSTLASKAVKRIGCRQRFVLTGTPIENRLSELWNLFDFLMPGYLFSHTDFVQRLEKPAVKSGDEAAMEQLRRLVRPFLLRRLKRDVLKELPPKIEHVRRIPLSEEERKLYAASSASARQFLAQKGQENGGRGAGKLDVLAVLTELRQICCAPELRFENYQGPSSKLEACMELCAGMVENGHQILLFSQFTSMLDRIRERLDGLGISHFTLQGSTSKPKRAQLVKAFNEGGASVFLISLMAGGTGLNLTAADVVIHYDPWWNPAAQAQATDRAHRIGQRSSVQVYKLIAEDTIEERILTLQSEKAGLMDAVTGGEGGVLAMSGEELLALLD